MNIECIYCHALGFKSENKRPSTHPNLGKLCCLQGNIKMPHFPELLPTLNALLTEKSYDSVKFRNNIQKFNSRTAMASCIVDETTILTEAPGAYTIKGMLCRKLGFMTPIPGKYPRFLQTYFNDIDYQHQQRVLFLQENPV